MVPTEAGVLDASDATGADEVPVSVITGVDLGVCSEAGFLMPAASSCASSNSSDADSILELLLMLQKSLAKDLDASGLELGVILNSGVAGFSGAMSGVISGITTF